MSAQFDIEKIRSVLRCATGDDGPFTQRGLSKAANEGRDAVGDIINGRNKNPTIKVLTNIAEAMGKDLSVFGIAPVAKREVNASDLERAFRDALPLPDGSEDTQARYLAGVAAGILGLPPSRPSSDHGTARPHKASRAKGALAQKPTKRI